MFFIDFFAVTIERRVAVDFVLFNDEWWKDHENRIHYNLQLFILRQIYCIEFFAQNFTGIFVDLWNTWTVSILLGIIFVVVQKLYEPISVYSVYLHSEGVLQDV